MRRYKAEEYAKWRNHREGRLALVLLLYGTGEFSEASKVAQEIVDFQHIEKYLPVERLFIYKALIHLSYLPA